MFLNDAVGGAQRLPGVLGLEKIMSVISKCDRQALKFHISVVLRRIHLCFYFVWPQVLCLGVTLPAIRVFSEHWGR